MKESADQNSLQISRTSKAEFTRNNKVQAGLTKVSDAPNPAALHAVEGVKIAENYPSLYS